MTSIKLTEGEDIWKVPDPPLTDGQAAVIEDFGQVSIERERGSGLWRVKAKKGAQGWAGRVRLGSGADAVQIQVTPKIPIARLLFLVSYTLIPVEDLTWGEEEIDAAAADEVVPAVAHAFARAATRALARGLPHGYREVEEASMVVRGRIRTSDQVREHWPRPFPVEIRYDEYVPDIPANQLLKAAVDRLLVLPGLIREDEFREPDSYQENRFAETVAMLRRLRRRLSGVSSLPAGCRPSAPVPGTIPRDAGWRAALSLAGLVLDDQSYELRDGSAAVADGLFLFMWRLFEDFVCVALKRQLEEEGGGLCTPQDERFGLVDGWDGRGERFSLKPDLVYDRPGPDGKLSPFAVIDAKYKTAETANQGDIRGVLSYCTVFGARHGYVVMPGQPARHQTHHVTNSAVTLTEYFLDLDVPPAEVRRQIRELAADILSRT